MGLFNFDRQLGTQPQLDAQLDHGTPEKILRQKKACADVQEVLVWFDRRMVLNFSVAVTQDIFRNLGIPKQQGFFGILDKRL